MCELRTWGQIVVDNTITSEIMRMYTTNQNRGSCLKKRERLKREKGENLVTRGMNKSFLKIVTVLDNFGGIPNTWSRCPLRLIRSRIYNLFFTRIYDNSGCSAAPAECHGLRYVKCN